VELKLVGYTTPFQSGKFIGFLGANRNLELVVLDVQFMGAPAWLFPTRTISLPRLRKLSFTYAQATDVMGLIRSFASFPRGVFFEVSSPLAAQESYLYSSICSIATRIQELLFTISTIKTLSENGRAAVQLYGGGSCFSFGCARDLLDTFPQNFRFSTTAVREFHTGARGLLGRQLSILPALETLVLVGVTHLPHNFLSFLVAEPVPCPSLKTIAFFDCGLDRRAIEDLEWLVAKRKESTAAWLYRIVIVGRTGPLPDHELIHRLRRSVPCVDAMIDEKLPDLS